MDLVYDATALLEYGYYDYEIYYIGLRWEKLKICARSDSICFEYYNKIMARYGAAIGFAIKLRPEILDG